MLAARRTPSLSFFATLQHLADFHPVGVISHGGRSGHDRQLQDAIGRLPPHLLDDIGVDPSIATKDDPSPIFSGRG